MTMPAISTYRVTFSMLGVSGRTMLIQAYEPMQASRILKIKLPYAEVTGTPELVS